VLKEETPKMDVSRPTIITVVLEERKIIETEIECDVSKQSMFGKIYTYITSLSQQPIPVSFYSLSNVDQRSSS
jgi:hypothetical protein